jgi:ABC-type hemin transport system substrate-binding protein
MYSCNGIVPYGIEGWGPGMDSTEQVPKSQIKVQVIPSPVRAGQLSPGKTWEALESRIKELGQSIGEIANQLRSELDASLAPAAEPPAWRLSDVEVTFSLDLEAEAGVVVARAKTTAGFEVSVSWKRE